MVDLIMERKRAGATVIMISHQMEEVEQLCDRVLLLKDGVARAYGTVDKVRSEFNNKTLRDIFIEVYGKGLK